MWSFQTSENKMVNLKLQHGNSLHQCVTPRSLSKSFTGFLVTIMKKKKKKRDKFQPKLKGKMFFVAEMFTYNVLVVSRQEKMKPSRKIKNTNDNTRVNTCKCASKFGIRKNKSNFEYLFLNWFIYYCYLEMTYFFIISNGLYFRTNCRLYVCGLSPFRGHACASDSFT